MSKQKGKNGNFEQSWKSAFSEAEVIPPSRVWNEIDHSLAQTQLGTLQKQTVVYKWTAAAAVFIAIAVSAMALSFNYPQFTRWLGISPTEEGSEVLAKLEEEESQKSPGNYAGFSILRYDNSALSLEDEDAVEAEIVKFPKRQDVRSIIPRSTYQKLTSIGNGGISATYSAVRSGHKKHFSMASPKIARSSQAILVRKPIGDLLATHSPDPGSYGVNGVIVNTVKRPILNAEGKTRFWSGVDVASGYFNPNYGPGTYISSQELLLQDAGSPESIPELSENMRGGTSYSIGINFGMELKNRWSVEVGALYSLLGARTITNLILESGTFNDAVAYSSEIAGLESVANLVESELTKLSVDDIQLNNTFQFISFPVQAGYKLHDRRFNITINGGIAANLYLGNTLKGRQNFSSFELEPGRRSPYRNLTLAAVTGFEIGYWIHRRVNITFEPTYQKNLQSLTKNGTGFVANPSGVGVQVGFKYDF